MRSQNLKYKIVVDWIMENIQNGSLKKGDKLPSENELSRKFGLSRQTIRHAIETLEHQKLLVRIQGSGTYIGEVIKEFRQERFMNVAVISTYVDSYIFPPVLRGIERELSKEGYTMQVAFTGNKIQRERDILDKLLEKGNIDGLIVEPAKSALPNPNLHYYHSLIKQQIPILFFNSIYPDLQLPCVAMDDKSVGHKAAEYFIKRGHREIAGIFKSDDGQGHLRYSGFIKGLLDEGLKIDSKRIIWLDTVEVNNFETLSEYIFWRLGGCSAVVCYNDEVAHLLVGMCQKKGIRIPEDLSIIGIDNSELTTMGDIQWSSFPHPMELLGKKAGENIIKMINNPYFDGDYRFDSDIVERDSVKLLGEGGKEF